MQKAISCTIFLLCSFTISAQSNWHFLPSAPADGGRLDDVFFLNNQLGWAASAAGHIFKTVDGGDTWETVYSTGVYFRCIEFFNDKIGYAGTLDNRFLRTTDGGYTWENLAPSISPSPKAVCGVSIVDSLYAYAVGEWDTPGFFLKTTDGGVSWTSHNMSAYANALVDVFFISRDTGFVTGQGSDGVAAIFYTTDGGQSWSKKFQSSPIGHYVWKIQRITPEVWVASIQTFNGGQFAKSLDGGQTWSQYPAPVPDMQGIGFATPQHGWVGGYVDGFYETLDGGETWKFQNFGGNFNRFYFLDSTLAYASGWSVYKFSDTTASSVSQPLQPLDVKDGFSLELSPNPASGVIQISYKLPVRDNLRMAIYRSNGAFVQEVYHARQVVPGEHQFQFDCASLPSGTYFLGAQRNCGLYSRPFTKM